jgi:hypothetical protein
MFKSGFTKAASIAGAGIGGLGGAFGHAAALMKRKNERTTKIVKAMKKTYQENKKIPQLSAGKGFDIGFKKTAKELAHGGMADNKPDSEFNKDSIKKGMKVEREHTKNKKLQKEIAKDHLKEDPKYYGKLAKMEKKADQTNKIKHGLGVGANILKNKASALGKHLHEYRRDYITGTAAGAAVSSAISNKKMGDKK